MTKTDRNRGGSDHGDSAAVAIQGGAMRSMYCLGALGELIKNDRLGPKPVFATSSAGCVPVVVALCSGFSHERLASLTTRLKKEVANTRFINKRRFWRVVDVKFLVERLIAMLEENETTWRSLEFKWVIVATKRNGQALRFKLDNTVTLDSLAQILAATMAIPILYPGGVNADGQRYYDGGVADPLPLVAALRHADGRRVVGIANVRLSSLGKPSSKSEARIIRIFPGIPSKIRSALLARNPLGDVSADIMRGSSVGSNKITAVFPDEVVHLGSRLDVTYANLDRIMALGAADMKRSLTE